jgi:release factor glutamine methyltransferase
MTVRDALREGAAALEGTETPFLDASLLLADALDIDTTRLHSSGPDEVGEPELVRYRLSLVSRSAGLPVAYLLGYKEFWGRRFAVDGRVLIPRADTELLVEAALKLGDAMMRERKGDAFPGLNTETRSTTESTEESEKGDGEDGFLNRSIRSPLSSLPSGLSVDESPCLRGESPHSLRVHEVCTGSGCVAISLAAERPDWEVSASDLSEAALEVAASNAKALLAEGRPGGQLALGRSDLLSTVPPGEGRGGSAPRASLCFDLIVANPPYVGSSETSELLGRGWSEPRMALDGGDDGLDLIRRLVPEAALALAPGGALLVEADGDQAQAVAELFRASRFIDIMTLRDLGGRPRVTKGRKPWRT